HQLFEAQVAHTPDSIALVVDAERMSYAELNRRANQVAHALRRVGVRPGVRVGLCFQPSIEFIVGLLGVLKAGAAYVPLDPAYPAERLGFMLDDAQLLVLLTQTGLATQLPEDRTRVIYLDRDWATIAQEPSDNLINLVTPDDLAYTIYTSGSTGQPKGASVYQRGVINLLHWFTCEFEISAEDRALVITSLSFDLTQKNLFAPLIMGGQLHLFTAKHYDVEIITRQIAEGNITLLNCTPSAFYPLADHDGTPARHRLASLRYVFLGGEPIAVARLEAWATRAGSNTQLVNTYGPTECTDIASFYRVDHLERFRDTPVPIGYPITNFSLFILDRQMEPVPVGVAGELYIGGIGLGQGYLNRPELTAEKFVPHPFSSGETGARLYRTGDLVRYQPDGAIVFLGRIDHQVKVRGFRIELGEIEVALLEHSALRDVVLVAREDASSTGGHADKQLVAYVVADTTPAPAVSELRSFLQDLLPEYMVPAAFVYLDALPLTPNGKVDRKALPAPEANRAELERSYIAPRTELERVLAQMWSEHFRLEHVGIHDSFFELGGNSIQGAVFINGLQELLGEYVSVVALFEAPNVANLASYLVSHHSTALARAGLTGEAGADRSEQPAAEEHSQLGQILPVPRGEDVLLPLSFAQQRLWFLDQLEPGSPLYNIPSAMRLQGKLDLHALQRTINIIAERHESLRTTFAVVDGQPIQVIASVTAIDLPTVDLRALQPDEREAAVQQLAIQEAQQPFDLERGPLMRVTLALIDSDDHVLLFTLHHIISDGWSMGLLIREVATIYMAVAEQRPVMLPDLRVQYADFAVWQRDWFQGPLLEQQLAYWQQQLRDAPAVLDLPTDRPRPAVQSFRGNSLPFRLAPELSQALHTLSQREGTTLFMTLLAAWYTLLFRYTGQHDILVGSPIANRTRKEIEGLIGFFVNTLVLRGDLHGNPSFRELLARVRQMAVGAFAHQDLPFEYLVEALQPERDLSRSPLFQVMFMLQNAPAQALQLPDLTLQPLDAHNGMAKFDLLLSLVEQPGELVGDLEYNTDLFDQTTMTRLLENFETLLTGIVADAAQPIGSLPLLTDAEQHQLVEWNATAMPYPALAAHQLVEQQTLRTPDSVAVIFENQQLTYRDLNQRANQLAHHLRDLGVGKDVPVGLCMGRSLELVVGMLGILKAGGAYVPLDPHYPAERLALMLNNAQAPVMLAASSQMADQRAIPEVPFAGTTVDLVGDWPLISQHPTQAPEIAVDLDQLAYVIYTSGSTGVPKGVAMPHRPLANMIAWQQTVIPGAARTLQFASPSFDVSFQEIFTTWAGGGTLVLPPEELRRDPEALAAFLDQQRIERLFMPFVALQQLAEALSAQGHVPADLRDVITAGEQLQITPAIAEWFRASPQCRLHNHYGPSETHVVTSHTLTGDPAQWPALPPIGKPIANTEAYLLDRGTQPLPIGAIGELYFAGDSLARGYLHRPELTAERFIKLELAGSGTTRTTRLYKTGDLARYRPDGILEFLGRADSQVKIRGYRIEPGEIENVLAQHEAVREAVVVVRPNADGMTQLVAYVTEEQKNKETKEQQDEGEAGSRTTEGHPVLSSTLRAYLKERLPDYMVPSALVVLESWPLTPSGKIDRRALPAPGDVASGTPDTFVAPRDTLELRLARIWEALLGVRTVGIRDNFFELGGHSLLVVRLMAQIQAQIGQKIPLATLFQEPTIEHLAQTLRQFTTQPLNTPLIAIQPGGDKLPFFCVHPAAGSVLSYLELARLLGPDQPFYGFQAAGLEGEQLPHTQV
ncbi:MAG: amino acid adenylation domain-containing protein, partial [Chloroflexi bacterium]|nr:amino acid adenylation domain-containing protein [Chloroflexota bacterium]